MVNAATVKAYAHELGFDRVGIVRAEPSPTLDAYFRWIEAGFHGEMGYMARPDRQVRRRDLTAILPRAQSLIVVALDYRSLFPPDLLRDPSRGRIAAYAWGRDYHDVMTPRLRDLADMLSGETDGASKVYVDTGALLERSHGQAAGLGFIGKNTMLIHPRYGSLFFLGEIITDHEFDAYDAPLPKATMCGSCTRCLTACPTNAFPQPHVLDSRRCISYLTIEHKTSIAPDLRPLMGNWIFGCDICNDVCPFQRFAPLTREPMFAPTHLDRAAPPLLDILAIDEEGFRSRFAASPVERIGRERLVRNACIAAGNWGDSSAASPLEHLLTDDSPLIRESAAWALERVR